MFNKKFIAELKNSYKDNESERRQIISRSNDILFQAKKVIFALQKNDFKKAELGFKEMEAAIISLDKKFGSARLEKEGAFKAAAEEYTEGKTLYKAIKTGKINKIEKLNLNYEAYLGGLCDMVGELVRYATNQAAAGKFSAVAKAKNQAEIVMEELADFDMTGYLRTKYDQARGHLRKLEQMSYEIKLRNKK